MPHGAAASGLGGDSLRALPRGAQPVHHRRECAPRAGRWGFSVAHHSGPRLAHGGAHRHLGPPSGTLAALRAGSRMARGPAGRVGTLDSWSNRRSRAPCNRVFLRPRATRHGTCLECGMAQAVVNIRSRGSRGGRMIMMAYGKLVIAVLLALAMVGVTTGQGWAGAVTFLVQID